ncbi:DCN1-like protein [Aspergillus stella-maris]|uniref:DCN1-like protein n=1 Tax=Aspergillus stella-maris TaxID=1810926 RepID=UPI003CCE2FFD
MPPYSAAQKQQIAQFVSFTQAKDTVATKVNPPARYFTDIETRTHWLLNIYYSPEENPDTIGIEGAMRYFSDIKVELDEVTCLAIAELLQSPSMGEFTREGFLNGWRSVQCDTLQKMTAHASTLRARIPTDPSLFRKIYRFTFPLCLVQGQRNLQFEIAVEQWNLFFTPPKGGVAWNTHTTPWLDWWFEFLESRGKRPVNKDLWNQVEVFMRKSHEDENFSWWSEDGAWPGALDDFVGWVREKRGGNGMEVE